MSDGRESSRIVAGVKPSGTLHLGNYFGALRAQAERASPTTYSFIADLHAIASGRVSGARVEAEAGRGAAIALALGVGARGAHLFLQSDVPEVLELHWLLGSMVRLEELEIDEDIRAKRERGEGVPASRLSYSLLMAADIVAYGATHVIVGADQEQHLRMAREFARQINRGAGATVVSDGFTRIPNTPTPVVLGADGAKMSKTAGNSLAVTATRAEIEAFVARIHRGHGLPNRVEECVIVNLLRWVDGPAADRLAAEYEACRRDLGWVAGARASLIDALDALMAPWRAPLERLLETEAGAEEVRERLAVDAARARRVAAETLARVRSAIAPVAARGARRPIAAPPGQPSALSYSEYVAVPAVLATLAPPAHPPAGVDPRDWPWADFAPSRAASGLDPGRGSARLPVDHPAWSHDEVLFITVHQTFELWFRQVLWELDDLVRRLTGTLRGHDPAAMIPHARMARRHPEEAARLHDPSTLAAFPRLAALVADIEREAADDPALAEYADWIRDSQPPGLFPGDADHRGIPLDALAPLLPLCTDRVGRATAMLKVATQAYGVLRRMTPKSFLDFRTRLDPASGFGSGQFRELEIFSGQRERHFSSFATLGPDGAVVDPELWALVVDHTGDPNAAAELAARGQTVLERALPAEEFARVRARMLGPTLRDLIHALLISACGAPAARARLADRVAAANMRDLYETGKRRRAHGFDHTSREREVWRIVGGQLAHLESVAATATLSDDPAIAEGVLDDAGRVELKRVLEACLELDEAIVEWRQAHLVFVEVMIGARPGTGGGGLVYLQETMRATRADYALRSFPAVWASRSLLVRDPG